MGVSLAAQLIRNQIDCGCYQLPAARGNVLQTPYNESRAFSLRMPLGRLESEIGEKKIYVQKLPY